MNRTTVNGSPESETLDLRGIPCPQNAAKAVLQLSMMSTDEVLLVRLDDGEPFANVTRSIEVAGHEIVRKEREGEGWALWVKVS